MSESLRRASEKAGLPPGVLVHVGKVPESAIRCSVIQYNKEQVEQYEIKSIEDVKEIKEDSAVTWINIEGLKNLDMIQAIGERFRIHSLVLEDLLNTHQRPKFEEYEDHLFVVLKGLSLKPDGFGICYEQISVVLLKDFVVTFKEKPDDLFSPLIQRLKNSTGRLRCLGADYLAYAILDTVVDNYFNLQDSFDEIIESIEDAVVSTPSSETLAVIQHVKRELIYVRRSLSPLREVFLNFQHSESTLIQDKTRIFFRDVYDHVIRVMEAMESYRDLISGLLDIYLSSINNRMNEVMKVLTVFASIFIPLTFIAGIYGMNFRYMPELYWKWSYPVVWGVFIAVPVCLFVYFKKKRWL